MSRSKKNWDHLVDPFGNYTDDSPLDSIHRMFVSFNGDSVDDYWGDYNVDRIEKLGIGQYKIYYKTTFQTGKYSVNISANGGLFRNHHVSTKAANMTITLTNRDNDPIDDSFLTVSAYRVPGSR